MRIHIIFLKPLQPGHPATPSFCSCFLFVFMYPILCFNHNQVLLKTSIQLLQYPMVSQEDFALESKLWPGGFFQHRPNFAGSLRSTSISQLWSVKTRSKRPRIQFLPKRQCIAIILPFMTHHNISLHFQARGRRVKNFLFSRISISL